MVNSEVDKSIASFTIHLLFEKINEQGQSLFQTHGGYGSFSALLGAHNVPRLLFSTLFDAIPVLWYPCSSSLYLY